MKKTLIALAAVAVSSAAMAQVTVSGKFGVAYTNGKGTVSSGAITSSTAQSSGFGVTDGDVVFTAVEEMTGGMRAGATMAVRVRGRGAAGVVDGRDGSVFLQGGFGRVTLDAAGNVDMASLSLPLVDGLTATVMLIDSIGAPGANGMQGTAATQDATLFGLAYAAGPISIGFDSTSFGKNAATTGTDSRMRVSASLNLGVAMVGAGYQTKETLAGVADKQMMFGVSVPMGAITVGATYALKDSDTANDDASGYELGANYAFSKRTNLQAAYLSQEMDVSGAKATNMRVRLMHSF